jgi:hypothetical protein
MSTQAQISANQENASKSTGPKTAEGKAASSKNAASHGLSSPNFEVQQWEDQSRFNSLLLRLWSEFSPKTTLEVELAHSLAQHRWLAQRAIRLQEDTFRIDQPHCTHPDRLALYLRYQTTHERAASKALRELQNLQQQRKKDEIGFVSQKQKAAEEARRLELHQARVRLANARASHLEIDSKIRQNIRQTCDATLPGHASDNLKAKEAA